MLSLQRLAAFALAGACTASAFQDASPLFMISTAPLEKSFDSSQIALSSHTTAYIKDSLANCPSDVYIIAQQPGVSAADYVDRDSAPHLGRLLAQEKQGIRTAISVPEVLKGVDGSGLAGYLAEQCRAKVDTIDAKSGKIPVKENVPRVVLVQFPELPLEFEKRASQLGEHDSFLNSVVSSYQDGSKYTIVYTTTPSSEGYLPESFARPYHGSEPEHPLSVYEMDEPFPSALHTELKRDLSSHAKNNASNLPLFEKYMFLSPALFMGLSVTLLLLSILYIGISALASLEVSYFAFSKEMGPSQQKKQQ